MASIKKTQEQRRKTLRPHPTRDKIIDAMGEFGRPISPTKLADFTDESLGSIAYHVRTLVAAGVVKLAQERRVRGAVEHYYALVPDTELPPASNPITQLLAACNASMITAEEGDYLRPVIVDATARTELQRVIDRLRPEVQAIVSQSTQRAGC